VDLPVAATPAAKKLASSATNHTKAPLHSRRDIGSIIRQKRKPTADSRTMLSLATLKVSFSLLNLMAHKAWNRP